MLQAKKAIFNFGQMMRKQTSEAAFETIIKLFSLKQRMII
ncbi:hypothetical protein RU85_GL000561 [Lactococcus garvieae]|nr:hypothetical protein RU85_GL000561 [Lactococcus garvieae]